MKFENEYGSYEINEFPGNRNLCISNAAFIKPECRGKGFGKKQHLERLQKMWELGYRVAICTVSESNQIEEYILKSFGWKQSIYVPGREDCCGAWIWIKRLQEIANDN